MGNGIPMSRTAVTTEDRRSRRGFGRCYTIHEHTALGLGLTVWHVDVINRSIHLKARVPTVPALAWLTHLSLARRARRHLKDLMDTAGWHAHENPYRSRPDVRIIRGRTVVTVSADQDLSVHSHSFARLDEAIDHARAAHIAQLQDAFPLHG